MFSVKTRAKPTFHLVFSIVTELIILPRRGGTCLYIYEAEADGSQEFIWEPNSSPMPTTGFLLPTLSNLYAVFQLQGSEPRYAW